MAEIDTWMPWHIAEYLADTMHLSTLEHGAYLLILGHGWRNDGTIVASDAYLAGVTRLPRDQWKAVRPTIEQFFDVFEDPAKGTCWRQKRQVIELLKAKGQKLNRIERAAKGAAAKWGATSKTNRADRMALAKEKGTHTVLEWEMMKAFYRSTCLKCHKQSPEVEIVKDHIKPIYMGGDDSVNNIQPLCRSCNAGKSNDCTDLRSDLEGFFSMLEAGIKQASTPALNGKGSSNLPPEEKIAFKLPLRSEEATAHAAARRGDPPSAKEEFWIPLCQMFDLVPRTIADEQRLLQQCFDFRLKGATVDEIARRGQMYRLWFPGAALTPKALLNNWDNVKSPPLPKPFGNVTVHQKPSKALND